MHKQDLEALVDTKNKLFDLWFYSSIENSISEKKLEEIEKIVFEIDELLEEIELSNLCDIEAFEEK